ncbi:MAG: HNH endonuclease [Polynucleobacter sp.]
MSQVIDLCANSLRNLTLKTKLLNIKPTIAASETKYAALGIKASLYLHPTCKDINGQVSADEMKDLYQNTFVKSNKTRHLYDSIKKSSPNDICPFCGQRTVSTVDHYLPKSIYADLTITPLNLLPSCADCNFSKRAVTALAPQDQTLHPYFDDADSDQWLFAKLEETTPAALTFFVRCPAHWDQIKQSRTESHFKTFKLAQLYASNSANELNNMRFHLQKLFAADVSGQLIKLHLEDMAETYAANYKNSWQGASYEALSASNWFHTGGFN